MTSPVRRGLVLGGGGVLGAAWMMAALCVIEDAAGIDARDSEVIVGTSAGSVLTAFLASGISTQTMVNHQQGIVVEGDPALDYDYDRDGGGALPSRPRLRFGSPTLLRATLRHPRRVSPLATLAALLPEGRGTLAPVGGLVDSVASPEWPEAPRAWIVAMDYENGRRTAFGRPGSPRVALSQAVQASCSIPGWYSPVVIGGRRYVDGGMRSSTSADLLARERLDEAYILVPMSALSYDRPRQVSWRLERRLRAAVWRQVERESAKLRAAGTRVIALAPTAEDLAVIGANMMDPRRREATFASALRTTGESLERAQAQAGGPAGRPLATA